MNNTKSHMTRNTNEIFETAKSAVSDTSPTPKLRLVNSSRKLAEIYDQVGLSHPKEVNPSCSEIVPLRKSSEHLQAIADVERLRAKKISATELMNRYLDTYRNWGGMKSRCKKIDALKRLPSIELHPSFEKFPDFLEIMGPRPEPSWSIDRIDPTGPYSPENARWADKITQARNRTNTVYLTYQGTTRPLVEWAEILGVTAGELRYRRNKGWSDEEIITGRKVQASSRIATSALTSSRNPLDHTPWPKNIQETMEREYQQLKKSDEHRLLFWKRYALEAMERISIQGESISWPDDYLPTDEQLVEVEELNRLHKRYQAILVDANKKLSPDHPPRLYKRRHLPEWVEERLEKYR